MGERKSPVSRSATHLFSNVGTGKHGIHAGEFVITVVVAAAHAPTAVAVCRLLGEP